MTKCMFLRFGEQVVLHRWSKPWNINNWHLSMFLF